MNKCLAVLIFLIALTPTFAQATGQFCVRAFEDLNGNGVREVNEFTLRGGISANLLDVSGIVIASALLDNSPTLDRGLICFEGLQPGQYSIEVISAAYVATTPNFMTDVVNADQLADVMEFGAQSIPGLNTGSVAPIAETVDTEDAVLRIVWAALGAFVAVVFMTIVGLVIYFSAFRTRRSLPVPDDRYRRPPPTTGTGGMPPVPPTSSHESDTRH
ncbi:MAG: hypothetical protein MUF87_02735 [Anaerolineae bacterium]|jgi:hypothetical protein|nr:hypothetical protein [Anaerolineae bacterium]